MAKCVDCGERIATWEDYCPKCGARKPVAVQAKEEPGASKRGAGLLGRLRKTP